MARIHREAFEVKTTGQIHLLDSKVYYEILIGEENLDDVHSLLFSIYAMKDNLKKLFVVKGLDPSLVESAVSGSPELSICIDLHNSFKHGGLDRKPRSGTTPSIKEPSFRFSVPRPGQDGPVTMPIYRESQGEGLKFVGLSSTDPGSVEKRFEVVDSGGKRLGDFFDIAAVGIGGWESMLKGIDLGG